MSGVAVMKTVLETAHQLYHAALRCVLNKHWRLMSLMQQKHLINFLYLLSVCFMSVTGIARFSIIIRESKRAKTGKVSLQRLRTFLQS